MMKYKVFLMSAVLASAAFLPSFVSADAVSDLQAQIDALLQQLQNLQTQLNSLQGTSTPSEVIPPETTPICPVLNYNLYLGQKDDETEGQVSELQKFLAQNASVYPEGLVTGYFGPLTEMAVKRWQAQGGVVSSGSSETTGYGVVGPQTRARIKQLCGGTTPPAYCPTDAKQCPNGTFVGRDPNNNCEFRPCSIAPVPPPTGCAPGQTKYHTCPDGTKVFWCACTTNSEFECIISPESQCTTAPPPSENLPPVITGLGGPENLNVAQWGTWTIQAYDPDGSYLTYAVNWGDNPQVPLSTAGESKTATTDQIASLSHVYSSAGAYTVIFTVTDSKGASVRTSITVRVGNEQPKTGHIKITVLDSSIICAQISCEVGADCPPCGVIYSAKVSVINDAGFVRSGDTHSGAALFYDLPVGNYTAKISAVGFQDKRGEFSIIAGESSYMQVYLDSIVVNNPPVIIESPKDTTTVEGKTLTFRWYGYDSDGDSLTWTVDWGDGSPKLSTEDTRSFTGKYTWNQAGKYEVVAVVEDGQGGKDKKSFAVWVQKAPILTGTVQISTKTEDNNSSAVITNKIYDSSGNLLDLASYGCISTIPAGSSILVCNLSVGNYTVKTSAADYQEAKKEFSIQAGKVTTVNLVLKKIPNNSPEITYSPSDTKLRVGDVKEFTWSAFDTEGDVLAWSINWGDGKSEAQACPATVSTPTVGSNDYKYFSASHSWKKTEGYTVTATVKDCRGGGTDSKSFKVSVWPASSSSMSGSSWTSYSHSKYGF